MTSHCLSEQVFCLRGCVVFILDSFEYDFLPQRQETYTPRLLAIDLKGSLHSLPSHGTLYSDLGEPSTSEASWGGQVEFIQQLPQEKNDFLKDLEQEDARFRGLVDEDKDICIGE